MAVVLVSHSMEDVANYAERIIVMNNGSVMFDDTPKKYLNIIRNWKNRFGSSTDNLYYASAKRKRAGCGRKHNQCRRC